MSFKGKVTNIPSANTSAGVFYNVEVDGRKPAYGFGKYPPKNFKVGDYIEFEADVSGKFPKMDYKSVRVIEPPSEPVAPSTARSNGYAGKGGGFNDDKRQEVISKQAARNSAIAMFGELRQLGAVPTGKAKASPSELFDLYIGIVDDLTQKYFDYSMGKVASPAKEAAVVEGAESVDEDVWGGNE
jgi:hypothetical protein